MNKKEPSIFEKYYTPLELSDRFAHSPADAVDVVIPILHTNELWRHNLGTIYREIPVNRLLIGDGGCIDDSIRIAKEFPRVTVFDHRSYKSLGYSIRKLIEEVETDWFIYPHSDVSLPSGWFDVMKKYKGQYDWFGCPQQLTVMVDYRLIDPIRPYAGTQLGRKEAFSKGLEKIDDDFVYRQEDFVFAKIVKDAGFKEGKVEDTFHYHQVIHKPSPNGSRVKTVGVEMNWSQNEIVRAALTQAKGIVKYLDPEDFHADAALFNVDKLVDLGETSWPEFRRWVAETNPKWNPALRRARHRQLKAKVKDVLKALKRLIRD